MKTIYAPDHEHSPDSELAKFILPQPKISSNDVVPGALFKSPTNRVYGIRKTDRPRMVQLFHIDESEYVFCTTRSPFGIAEYLNKHRYISMHVVYSTHEIGVISGYLHGERFFLFTGEYGDEDRNGMPTTIWVSGVMRDRDGHLHHVDPKSALYIYRNFQDPYQKMELVDSRRDLILGFLHHKIRFA